MNDRFIPPPPGEVGILTFLLCRESAWQVQVDVVGGAEL